MLRVCFDGVASGPGGCARLGGRRRAVRVFERPARIARIGGLAIAAAQRLKNDPGGSQGPSRAYCWLPARASGRMRVACQQARSGGRCPPMRVNRRVNRRLGVVMPATDTVASTMADVGAGIGTGTTPAASVAGKPGPSSSARPSAAALAVYLTPRQVAELIQVSEKTVLRWSLEDASMPVLRRGAVVRFHRDRLMVWLERQEPRLTRQRTHDAGKEGQNAA